MTEPRGSELIRRYKENYAIPGEAPVTEEMILAHWELEKSLTEELLASSSESRWEVFDRCYTELYSRLDWLNRLVQADRSTTGQFRRQIWRSIIGDPPKRVYEIGSGKAELITYLAKSGFICKAAEITRERGPVHSGGMPNLIWGISDGVHLDRFEPPDAFDLIISDQVIEHLHPDDVHDHFRSAWTILAQEGRYIFSTPHQCAGPADISAVFRHNQPRGMHLHEYTYGELNKICIKAGFAEISAVWTAPLRPSNGLVLKIKPWSSRIYLYYLCALEKLLLLLPRSALRRKITKLMRLLLFAPNIFMIARKTM